MSKPFDSNVKNENLDNQVAECNVIAGILFEQMTPEVEIKVGNDSKT